jgi:hypothetical protein
MQFIYDIGESELSIDFRINKNVIPRIGESITSDDGSIFKIIDIIHHHGAGTICFKLENTNRSRLKRGNIHEQFDHIENFKGFVKSCVGCKFYHPVVDRCESVINCWCDNADGTTYCSDEAKDRTKCGPKKSNFKAI